MDDKEKEEPTKEPRYRIMWRHRENGREGQSRIEYSLDEANLLVSDFNIQYPKIEHWHVLI